jgi:diguanylate cyclase (GGDEF)-like protein/PAS domain S-box-containing protein
MAERERGVTGAEPPGGWELAFHRAPVGMGVLVGSRFVAANAALCELLGRGAEELIGSSALEVAGTFVDDGLEPALEAYRRGETHLHVELELERHDGERRWVAAEAVVTPAGEGHGAAAGKPTTLLTANDVTGLHEARSQLAASARRMRSLLTNLSDTVSLTDAEGRLLYSTQTDNFLLGYDAEFWSAGMFPITLVHPDDEERALAGWRRSLERPGEEVSEEVRMRAADGSWQDVAVTGVNLLDDPDVRGIVVTSRNITALRRAERLASSQAHVLELIARGEPLSSVTEACVALLEENGMGGTSSIYLLEDDRLELRAGTSPAALAAWVREPVREPGRSICDQAMADAAPVVAVDLRQAHLSPGLRAIVDAEGIVAAWSLPILSVRTGQPVGSLSTIYRQPHQPGEHERQVAEATASLVAIALERVETEGRLAHQALHDGLTGLPNRTLLLDRLDHALARRARAGARIALLFCDIDRFKVVNDSLGHGVGDQLLVAFAERLRTVVDPGDTVARFGGDEFVVLIEELRDDEHPARVAQAIAAALEAPFLLPAGKEVFLTVSIGVAAATDHRSGDAWLRDADAAMYRAKERGRNRLAHFDTEMREAALVRLQVESDLRRAVDRDELVVHYQPVIDLRSGRVAGAEALVRWQHPERGLLSPADFIAVAEDIGTIAELGRHVLDVAVASVSELVRPGDGRTFQLGVNVSARQLALPGLDQVVAEVLEAHGWPAEALLLEITESALIPGFDQPIELLDRLAATGVALAIDDFGTGHSSLARLGHLPVSQVKIDQAFVGALDQPGNRLARIVDAVAAVARALSLRTSAEGVETQAQLDHLRRLRCDWAQGYLFSKPLPLDDLAELLEADPRW